jgi:EmrB/QacA subfamily drug resistance transporter
MDRTEASDPDRLAPGTGMALAAMAAAVFVVTNDFTAPAVALPTIEHDFNADIGSVQWVINAYSLLFGILIVTGGRLADMFGRRRMFFIGAAIFAGFSALAGAAQSVPWLITARALMAIGGALMWPATIGMTFAALPKAKAGLAGGFILGVAGLGNALGPMIGGLLTEQASWRWLFFLNVPIAALACAMTWWKIHQPSPDEHGRLDYAGMVTISAGLAALLIALDQSSDWGFADWRVILLLACTVALLVAFVHIERREGKNALIPPNIIANREFAAACTVTILLAATFYSMLLYLPQFMVKLLGYGPFKAGVALLPLMILFSGVSFASGPLYNRIGPKKIVCAGGVCYIVAAYLLSRPDASSGYLDLVPGMAVAGIGMGLVVSSLTTAAVTTVDEEHASLASGVVFMFQTAGGSLGLGLTTAVFTAAAQQHVHNDAIADSLNQLQEHAVNGVLVGTDGAQALLARLPGQATHIKELAADAFAAGMHAGFLLDAGLAVVGLVVAALYIGGPLRLRPLRAAVDRDRAAAGGSGVVGD